MIKISAFLALPAIMALAACASEPAEPSTEAAEEFAARINGAGPTAGAGVAPTVAQPLEGAAEGAFSPGTATDPGSSTCAANAMGPFIGKEADDATRAQIMTAAAGASEVRFIPQGSPYVRPDPTNPRLNLMLDNLGIIRDARCG